MDIYFKCNLVNKQKYDLRWWDTLSSCEWRNGKNRSFLYSKGISFSPCDKSNTRYSTLYTCSNVCNVLTFPPFFLLCMATIRAPTDDLTFNKFIQFSHLQIKYTTHMKKAFSGGKQVTPPTCPLSFKTKLHHRLFFSPYIVNLLRYGLWSLDKVVEIGPFFRILRDIIVVQELFTGLLVKTLLLCATNKVFGRHKSIYNSL